MSGPATMTELLEKAFEEASKLPPPEQDALAARLLEEITADRRWDEAFAGSADALARLADEALAQRPAGDRGPGLKGPTHQKR